MYYAHIRNNTLLDITEVKYLDEDILNVGVEDFLFNEYQAVPNKFKFDAETNLIIENPDYEIEKAKEAKNIQIEELKAQLNAIDIKTIRALRAGETEYLQEYEAQAVELREQLAVLERSGNGIDIDT